MPFISYNKTVCFPKDLYIEFSLTDGECVKGFYFYTGYFIEEYI